MFLFRLALLLSGLLLSGCSTVHLSAQTKETDPFEPYNRKVYVFNDTVDKVILKPTAQAYAYVMPDTVKTLVNNFFSNLDDVTVTANDLLQLKFARATSNGSRVLFNSTFGVFGLLNVTTHLEKHNEDFGQTLGYWGCNSGPYLVIPFWGPSSVRDGTGMFADSFVGAIGTRQHVPTRNTVFALNIFNNRVNLLDQEKVMDDATIDRYSFLRDAYMMRRQSLVYDGSPPRIKYDDEDEE